MRIVILDYGVGNIRSVEKAFQFLGYSPTLSKSAQDVYNCDLLIMPGQGAFGTAIDSIRSLDLEVPIKAHLQNQKPFLGICVGFQLLFSASKEKGLHQGLDIISGTLSEFPKSHLKVPHMGWNKLVISEDLFGYFKNLPPSPQVYFVHSYYAPESSNAPIAATCDYGTPFIAAVQSKNLLATQFHPEKSGGVGIQIIKNFMATLS